MHEWGDEWDEKYGQDLDEAIREITTAWLRAARLGSRAKEKWGTFRDHPVFWDGGLHSLIWPSYAYTQNAFIAYKLDEYLIKPLTRYLGLHALGVRWQKFVYAYYIKKACKKYPHLVTELTCAIAYPEFLK